MMESMRFGRVVVIATLALGGGAMSVLPILDEVGRWLVVADALETADAIFVLGGAIPARELGAAALYHGGLAPRIVLSRIHDGVPATARRLSGELPYQERQARVLEHALVPSVAIVQLQQIVESTRDELEAYFEYARQQGFRRVILVTSAYHTRRARIIWRHKAAGRLSAAVYPTPYDPFDPNRWWRSRHDLEVTIHELAGIAHFMIGSPLSPYGER